MFLSRAQQVLIVLSLLALLACAVYGLYYVGRQRAAPDEVAFQDSPFPAVEKPETILVHVAGQVKKPGVYHLKPGARVQDALAAAQGSTQDADVHALNLAAFLRDGEKVWVPGRQEAMTASLNSASASPSPTAGRASPSPSANAPSNRAPAKPSAQWLKQHKVSLNRANAAQLQQLPGIGPAMAERILQYRREHGRFNSIEDLMNVSGIGSKRFEQLRDLVTP